MTLTFKGAGCWLTAAVVCGLSALAWSGTAHSAAADSFRFAILGDRTGEAQPGVYEEAWRETALEHPAFIVTVGDTIEGGNDLTVNAQWRQVLSLLTRYSKYPTFFTPGNHDVWSLASARAYEHYTKRPLHYSFDYRQAHFVILDDSRSDEMPAAELAFLRNDLERHQNQPVKFVFSHRPSWIFPVVLGNPNFALHQLAKKFGVRYVIAGHIHQMLRFELDGITYLSMASSGGHLRDTKSYARGWFFEHTLVTVKGNSVSFQVEELSPPFGKARVSKPSDWGAVGLISQ